MSVKHLELLHGHSANTLLRDNRFISRWRSLHDNCPHATACQEPEFVCAWYEEYQDQWEPVIIYSRNLKDDLIGLFLLAYDPVTMTIAHAGENQAEYHIWLTLPDEDVWFISAAWSELVQHFKFAILRFRYLPIGELGDTLKNVPALHNKVIIRKSNRPLLKLDPDDVKASFAKKSNKSRFNRLKKLGNIEFRRITDCGELERVFDDLIDFYDFRQGAVNHSTPFRQDPRKSRFYSSLFAADPDKVYVTVTYLDERPIAGVWGLIDKKKVHIAMIMHSPFLAQHSPGKLHIMRLSEYLLKAGFEALDITPGGAPWKERFANAHDEVAEAVIYRTAMARIRAEMLYRLLQLIKRNSAQLSISTDQMRSALTILRRARPSAVIRKVRYWVRNDYELRIYRIERAFIERFRLDERLRCNLLSDLLSYEQDESWQSRNDFLSNSLTQLEYGESVYTINIGNKLAHYGWMALNQTELYIAEAKQSMTFPPGSVIFHNFYSRPDFRCRGLFRATIGHMLHEAFAREETQYVYISVPANNMVGRHVIETMGFQRQCSYFLERRFGNERKRTTNFIPQSKVIDTEEITLRTDNCV